MSDWDRQTYAAYGRPVFPQFRRLLSKPSHEVDQVLPANLAQEFLGARLAKLLDRHFVSAGRFSGLSLRLEGS